MNAKKIFNLFISYFVAINLILSPLDASLTNSQAQKIQRTKSEIDKFIKSQKPSDIPYIEYGKSLTNEMTAPVQDIDLSNYKNKYIYVGYGLYDQDNKYCRYLDLPNLNRNSQASDRLETYFERISVFNNHTYAISINNMTLDKCRAKVAKFGGKLVSITSAIENSFIQNKLMHKQNSNAWIGLSKDGCNGDWINSDGDKQQFFNWSGRSNLSQCSNGYITNAYMNKYGNWVNNYHKISNAKCIIEIDSPDYTRPIKVCSSWWRIEREYKKAPPTKNNWIYRINQADIPDQLTVCTKLNKNKTNEIKSKPKRQVQCVTYYQATKHPECLFSPFLKQCYVDECNGYIKNVCKHIKELVPYKDYTKTKAIKDGHMQWIKDKVQIRTQIYECPSETPSLRQSCEEKSTVVVFPKECPGSQCKQLKECVYSALNEDTKKKCYEQYKCEKIYPNADTALLPENLDSNGKLLHLSGYCKDGTKLIFPLNIQNKEDRKCLEYEKITLKKKIIEQCKLDRGYEDKTVDMSITGTDIYETNPDCIRLNNVSDARPEQQLTLDVQNFGFNKLHIIKSLFDQSTELVGEAGFEGYVKKPDNQSGSENIDNQSNIHDSECSDFDANWLKNIGQTLGAGTYQKIESNGHGYMNYYNTIGVQTDSKPETGNDYMFQSMIHKDNGATFITRNAISNSECQRYARCLSGYANEYSGNKVCTIDATDMYDTGSSEPTIPPVDDPVDCKPPTEMKSFQTSLNGVKDIFYIEDTTGGPWGYYSNHSTWMYKSSKVLLHGLEIFPIKEISKIVDHLIYEGLFHQFSIRSVDPNIVAGSVGGSAAGGAAYVAGLASTGIGIIAVAVFVIVAIFFASKKKYNNQESSWELYKLVPKDRYIPSPLDFRILEKSGGSPVIHDGKYYKLIYANFNGVTGTLEPPDFKILLNNWWKQKQQLFMCMGFEKGATPYDRMETNVVVSYPHCSWWDFWCDKINDGTDTAKTDPFPKDLGTYYKGATNTVSIVVPFIGDYKVEAFDKNDNKLGSFTVKEDNFISAQNNKASYAQLLFGTTMDLSDNIEEGNTNNACRFDLMVEWGGGVSGIYYENDNTGLYSGCSKSDDQYVKDHSATKFIITPINQNKGYVVKLTKPLPFANRIFLVTLDNKEIREYRCYKPFRKCNDNDFQVKEDN